MNFITNRKDYVVEMESRLAHCKAATDLLKSKRKLQGGESRKKIVSFIDSVCVAVRTISSFGWGKTSKFCSDFIFEPDDNVHLQSQRSLRPALFLRCINLD